jgi:hypothetical protein
LKFLTFEESPWYALTVQVVRSAEFCQLSQHVILAHYSNSYLSCHDQAPAISGVSSTGFPRNLFWSMLLPNRGWHRSPELPRQCTKAAASPRIEGVKPPPAAERRRRDGGLLLLSP